jgi:hypothetical protein
MRKTRRTPSKVSSSILAIDQPFEPSTPCGIGQFRELVDSISPNAPLLLNAADCYLSQSKPLPRRS